MHASVNVGWQGTSGPGKIHEVILFQTKTCTCRASTLSKSISDKIVPKKVLICLPNRFFWTSNKFLPYISHIDLQGLSPGDPRIDLLAARETFVSLVNNLLVPTLFWHAGERNNKQNGSRRWLVPLIAPEAFYSNNIAFTFFSFGIAVFQW